MFDDPQLRDAQYKRLQDLEAARSMAAKVDKAHQGPAALRVDPPLMPSTEETLELVERLLSTIEPDDERRSSWTTLREVDQQRLGEADLRAFLDSHPELRRTFVDEIVARASEIEMYATERQAREMPRPGG